jgi:murein DD-endopeptidase MepM/ murein hydrolase activator NlpD
LSTYLRGYRLGLYLLVALWLLTGVIGPLPVANLPSVACADCVELPDSLLPYGPGSTPRITQDWHGLSGWAGYDYATACGEPLYSPVNGVVTYNGLDGYNHVDRNGYVWPQNTMLKISFGDAYNYVLLHGDYIPQVGEQVRRGQLIGYEASHGWSTGCHSHITIQSGENSVKWRR